MQTECTSFLVGRKQTEDNSMIIARSEDAMAMEPKNLEIFEDSVMGPEEFVALDSPFRCKLPQRRLGYSALSPYHLHGHWGSAGFNSVGVGMSATETIFSSAKALRHDPYVEDGVAENSVYNIVIPYIHSAREGVERLGSLIEKYGSAEGFGISFVDDDEIWYLENACGHEWLACKLPEDVYFVTGNQSRFRDYDPEDRENYMASANLISFAEKNGLYEPKDGKFDFHKAYSRDEEEDTTYNYPRVWYLQKLFSPSIENDVTKNTFPVFTKAEKPISISDLRMAYRTHYNGTEHDPYLHNNGKEPWRPISIFRTTQTHILQLRPGLPIAIGRCNYMAEGMAALGVFLPLYQGVKSYPKPYLVGNESFSEDSAYWKFRKVMTLGMVNYNRFAPLIQETYARFEAETDARQKEMEEEYLKTYKEQPMKAQDLLQKFSDDTLNKALCVADKLTLQLFTMLAKDIQKEYLFHGA